ncbi:MAG: putative LPS assembly protein LptD [Dysgonamonadaceae bacterium]
MKQSRIGTYSILAIFLLVTVAGTALPLTKNKNVNLADQTNTSQQKKEKRQKPTKRDTSSNAKSVNDSIVKPTDSISADSLHSKKQILDATVNYSAKDSIIFTEGNWAYLYGSAEVKYKNLGLKGEHMTTNLDSSTVWAKYGIDSLGKEFGYPEFSQGESDKYEAKTIKYNFKSKKGYITHVVTQQGEGYIVAEEAKKNPDNSIFMRNGKYTTCDDHEHPHFYLNLTKAKVRPKKDVVTGPAYLVVEDVPLPIAIPFAFFPFSSKYSSGIIFPSYADELERGFGLRDGGYYFAINKYVDLALTGEIYTKGSWGINAESTYKRRYKYTGHFAGSYLLTKSGDKAVPSSYSVSKDLSIKWSHSQDSKANTFRQLSASVNYQTSSYNHNSLTSLTTSDYTSNTKSSTVSLTQTFPNSKWSLGASMNIVQRSSDSTVAVTLPSLNVSMSRIFPFKRKNPVGTEHWYEKIYMSYSGVLSNSITTKDNLLFKANLIKDWKNGARHTIPVGASFTIFNHINVTPSLNYDEQWHTHKIYKVFNDSSHTFVPLDTMYGFYRTYSYSTALSFQTKLYGFYKPIIGGNKIQAIRHVFTPSISLSYNPDFTSSHFGFWKQVQYMNADGTYQTAKYSPFEGNVYSPSSSTKAGSINFSLQNNLEMKVRSEKDSTGWKIISLIDNFTASTSYNMMASSFRWSNISTTTRLKLSKSLTVNINAIFDPYTYEVNKTETALVRVDKLRISRYGSIGRLMSTGYSFSPSLNQDSFNKWFGKKDKGTEKKGSSNQQQQAQTAPSAVADSTTSLLNGKKKDTGSYDSDGYLKNEIKWNLSFSYSFNYAYDNTRFNPTTQEYKYKLTHNLSVSGNIQPTKNWNFSFNTSYNFDQKRFPYMSCSLSRDLHCFSLTGTFVPIGPYKTYYVSLRVKSSMLQDLKYEQRNRSSSYDPEWP